MIEYNKKLYTKKKTYLQSINIHKIIYTHLFNRNATEATFEKKIQALKCTKISLA